MTSLSELLADFGGALNDGRVNRGPRAPSAALLEAFDPKISTVQNLHNHGFYRTWDCGQLVYSLAQPV